VTRRLFAALLAAGLSVTAAAQPPSSPPKLDPKAGPKKNTPEEDKAVELFRVGKLDDALAELRKAVKANPLLPPPRVRLAELLIQAGQGGVARGQLEIAAAEDPTHPSIYLLDASMDYGEGRVTDTILACKAALALADDPRWDADQRKRFAREARMGLAAGFEARRDWASAKEHLTAVLNDDPKNAVARQRMAAAVFWLGGPEQAFADLQAAHADDPTTDLPELRMAQLWGAKDEAKAEEWLKKAVAAHPKDAKAHRAYAAWLLDNGKTDAAQLYVDSAAKLDPNAHETIALRGLVARYKKDFAAAEQTFDGLHREYPNDKFAAWNLALVLSESADPSKKRRAVDIAEAETRKNPRDSEGFAVLGWCYFKAGRLDDADKALGTAAAASGGHLRTDTAYFIAHVLAERGRTAEALRLVKDALNARGAFPFRADAQALLTQLEKQAPKKN
jgi:Tfp pilus assembly protein PilF